MLKRQEAGRSVLLAAVMPSKGDGAGIDTFRPHRAYGQLRNTENRQRLRGLATASLMPPLRLIAVPPCSLSLLPDKAFYDRPATCRLFQQSTGRDSDNPPSFVVGLSQTRPAGTGLFHFSELYCFFQINHVSQCYPFLNNRSGVIISEEIWNTMRIGIATRFIESQC